MKKIILAVATILISVTAFSQYAESVRHFEKGTKAIKSGDYQKGINYLTSAIAEYPTADAYFNRAAAYFYIGDTCSYCSDLKNASVLDDYEAKKLYIEKCTYCVTVENLSDSMKSKNCNIKYVQIFHSKCNSDSTISYIFEKTESEFGTTENSAPDSPPVFTIVEEMPLFPGGENERNRFLAMNITYPELATKHGIQGTIYITFIIDREGSVTNVKVLRGIGGGCDEEAVRVIKLMPKWIPGKQNGKTVNVLFNMPIYFKIGGKR